MIPAWLTSPAWTDVVKALLHTLWQGMMLAGLLGLALRRLTDPDARYRCALAALVTTVAAGVLTWGILCRPLPAHPPATMRSNISVGAEPAPAPPEEAPLAESAVPAPPETLGTGWTAWLALFWLTGAAMMLGRAGFQVAGAERLRRSSCALADPRVARLLEEARRAVNLTRRVRLAVTDQLASPVVAGVLAPTLILPLTLTTTLTPEQIRFIFLHELAHIRRGDYFANLFQLFAEALLFFNPAVWWISRQMRLEREACCDALAVELSGAPADYARTLVRVVENLTGPAPAAAPALGGRREPSSLADRVQRMLVPGYRPALRLTWRAMFAALLTGSVLLFLSALGTRETIAALLTPQERIERIEKKMSEYGQIPAANEANGTGGAAASVKITGHLRLGDGSPVPQWVSMTIRSVSPRGTSVAATRVRNGAFAQTLPAGQFYICAEMTNFAPAIIGPLDGFATNAFENVELVFERGFDVPVQVVEAESGTALSGGVVAAAFESGGQAFQRCLLTLDANGSATLAHGVDLPLNVTVNVPGHEILQRRFDHVRAGETLRLAVRRGRTFSGQVLDRATAQPLAGAVFHLLYQAGAEIPGRFGWDDPLYGLGQSGADGAFSLDQLEPGYRYYLGVTAPGHASAVLENIVAGDRGFIVKLGPELLVRGRVTGNLAALGRSADQPTLVADQTEVYDNNSWGNSQWVPVQVADGVGTFQFTNRTAGHVTLSGGGWREERDITAPIDHWEVDIPAALPATDKSLAKREVIFRFASPANISPGGTVEVTIPDNLDPGQLTVHDEEMAISNREVRVWIPVGGQTEIAPKHMVGYWFDHWRVGGNGQSITVTNGEGPLVVTIPLLPAGAIYAQARNPDGTPAGELFFGVDELKRAAGRTDSSPLDAGGDGFSGIAPRRWVSGPLPLGGTYQIHAWRGNAFCVSPAIKLTEGDPDAEAQLQFAAGKAFAGTVLDAGGNPVVDGVVNAFFTLPDKREFGLQSVFTDAQGRFRLENTTPEVGAYLVEVIAPGELAERIKLNFDSQPQILRLQRGRALGGRMVEAGTGLPVPFVAVRAWASDGAPPQPAVKTDADGRFAFTTLGEGEYVLYAEGGQLVPDQKYRADGNTNLTLNVKLYAGNKARPQAPTNEAGVPATNAAPTALRPIAPRLPQALITAEFYKLPDETFNQVVAPLQFDPGTATPGWWRVRPEDLTGLRARLKQTGLTPLTRPRIQTTSGKPAQFYVGDRDGTNHISLDCLPVIEGSQIDLSVHGAVVETTAGNAATNQFSVHAALPDHGGLVVRARNPDGSGPVAAVVWVNILTNSFLTNSSASFQQRLVRLPAHTTTNGAGGLVTPPAGQTNDATLFMRTFKVDTNAFLAYLRRQGSATDSVAFATAPVAVVRNLIRAAGVELNSTLENSFSYNDDAGVVYVKATRPDGDRKSASAAGGDLKSTPGESFFYNDTLGLLFVKATEPDLDRIEAFLGRVVYAMPQFHLKARFFQAPKGTLKGLEQIMPGTNSADSTFTGILTRQGEAAVRQALLSRAGVELLGEPEVTVSSARRVQVRATRVMSATTNLPLFLMDIGSDSILLQTNSVELGPVLDVVPRVLADGATIHLTATPSCNEFIGWAQVGASVTNHVDLSRMQLPHVLPEFRVWHGSAAMEIRDNQTVVMALPEPPIALPGTPPASAKPDREMLVFFTLTLVDASGSRVNADPQPPTTSDGIPPK